MKLTIDTDVLEKEGYTLQEFITLLVGYFDINVEETVDSLREKGLIEDKSLFQETPVVLSNNAKDYVAKLIVDSDEKVSSKDDFFTEVATALRELYPKGKKLGTTYNWRSSVTEVAQKLKILTTKYDFKFSFEEAIHATELYLSAYKDNLMHMRLLKYFILKTEVDKNGNKDFSSEFIDIIENNRENDT